MRFIKKGKPNLIAMDIETRTLNKDENIEISNVIPVCISIYDGNKKLSFFIYDYKSSNQMLISAIKSILLPKYNHHIVILHNFSYFDGIIIFKTLTKLAGKIVIIQRDGRLIETKILFGKNLEFTISFRDSFLMLPSSLESLAKSFGVQNKSLFPLKFLNDPVCMLNYIGKVPTNLYYHYFHPLLYQYLNLIHH
jgi:DNA polymerase elongation subunit (family B)